MASHFDNSTALNDLNEFSYTIMLTYKLGTEIKDLRQSSSKYEIIIGLIKVQHFKKMHNFYFVVVLSNNATFSAGEEQQ